MLRPSRPMIRPFMSSLGRSTTDTVVSMACSAALRWMASATICWARAAAVSRASVSRRFTRLAASRLASASSLPEEQVAGFVGGQPGDTLEFALLLGDELVELRGRRGDRRLALGEPGITPLEVGFEALDRVQPLGERLRLVGEALLGALRLDRGARATASRPRPAAGAPVPSTRGRLPSCAFQFRGRHHASTARRAVRPRRSSRRQRGACWPPTRNRRRGRRRAR